MFAATQDLALDAALAARAEDTIRACEAELAALRALPEHQQQGHGGGGGSGGGGGAQEGAQRARMARCRLVRRMEELEGVLQ